MNRNEDALGGWFSSDASNITRYYCGCYGSSGGADAIFFFMYGNNFWKNLFYQSITTYRNVQKSLMYSFMKFHKVKVQITPGPKEQPKAPNSPKGKYYPDF